VGSVFKDRRKRGHCRIAGEKKRACLKARLGVLYKCWEDLDAQGRHGNAKREET